MIDQGSSFLTKQKVLCYMCMGYTAVYRYMLLDRVWLLGILIWEIV